MMLPARTVSLPNFFTPRRLLSLSRPLRDEPPAFLCAMLDYFFEVFLAPPLAGAAFFVDPDSAFALEAAAPSALLAAGFFAAGLTAPAALASLGAGFAVGVPVTSPPGAFSPLTVGSSLLAAGLAGAASALAGAAFFSAPSDLLATCL